MYWRNRILAFAACVAALIPMFDIHRVFYVDWVTHVWAIEYFGRYFKEHHVFPVVFNTSFNAGDVFPIFYGEKFYALAGLIASIVGAALAIRLCVLLVLTIAAFEILRCVRSLGAPTFIAFAIMLPTIWDTYLLTDLYNRNALPEFIAIAFTAAALASTITLSISADRKQLLITDAIRPGLYFTLAAVAHPLTALFGGITVLLVSLCGLLSFRRLNLLGVMFASGIASILALSPWLYVSALLAKDTVVVGDFEPLEKSQSGFFPASIDAIWSRLSLIPLDWRSVLSASDPSAPAPVSTPYLEAQVSMPLILLAIYMMVASARRKNIFSPSQRELFCYLALFVAIAIFCIATAVSVAPQLSELFGGVFNVLQFPYRLTAYSNLAAMTGCLAAAGLVDWDSVRSRAGVGFPVVVAICLTLAGSNLIQKLIHAAAIVARGAWATIENVMDIPPRFPAYSFMAKRGLPQAIPQGLHAEKRLYFGVGNISDRSFGVTMPATIDIDEISLVVTDVLPSQWNRLIVDGTLVPIEKLITVEGGEAVVLLPGSHELAYVFQPNRIWTILHKISWAILITWICLSLLATISAHHPSRLKRM